MANNFTKVVALALLLLALLQAPRAVSQQLHDVPATMTLNGFQQGESGGGPAACDGQYHSDQEFIVSLSSRWFDGGARCGRLISILMPAKPQLYSLARVVDECRDCDDEVGVSPIVWGSFLLDPNLAEATITWSDVN